MLSTSGYGCSSAAESDLEQQQKQRHAQTDTRHSAHVGALCLLQCQRLVRAFQLSEIRLGAVGKATIG